MTDLSNSKIAFISSADSRYFPMLLEWVHSIKQSVKNKNFDLCIIDAGLTPEERETIEAMVTTVSKPDWPENMPEHKKGENEFYKACVCRPFLNKIFPGYDYYFWMDADTWIQDPSCIDYFFEGASKSKMTLTAAADRAYPKSMRLQWLGRFPFKAKSFYFSNAKKAFDIKTAKALFPQHNLSAGAFCLHKDAPHWDAWQKTIIQALQKGKVFTAEQLSLGVIIHLQKLPIEILPAYMHWFCQQDLVWDQENKAFVEPYLPHQPIGILHLSGHDQMRVDRSVRIELSDLSNQTVKTTYRYPLYDGEKQQELS